VEADEAFCERLARCFDRRDPARIAHTFIDMIRARIFVIGCGYEDAVSALRSGVRDRLRASPRSRLAAHAVAARERARPARDVVRLTYALDQWMASYDEPPSSVTLVIDDTCDIAHGDQQLSLFNAHYDERCFLPIHGYDNEKSRPVAVVLPPGDRSQSRVSDPADALRGSHPQSPAFAGGCLLLSKIPAQITDDANFRSAGEMRSPIRCSYRQKSDAPRNQMQCNEFAARGGSSGVRHGSDPA
jgi:hypothetical protein